jgi:hypothetical protein
MKVSILRLGYIGPEHSPNLRGWQKGEKETLKKLFILMGTFQRCKLRREGWCQRSIQSWIWRRLVTSPANQKDSLKLELPGAWEPLDNSGSSPDGEGKEAQFCFSDGDYVFKTVYGSNKVKIRF